mmetsp:Transcript_32486/g.69625  ORF Transcript_32486/g.69625 Transcript_32486/m.69625 type:complete len:224 (-) Transcript_32486:180-851(-)
MGGEIGGSPGAPPNPRPVGSSDKGEGGVGPWWACCPWQAVLKSWLVRPFGAVHESSGAERPGQCVSGVPISDSTLEPGGEVPDVVLVLQPSVWEFLSADSLRITPLNSAFSALKVATSLCKETIIVLPFIHISSTATPTLQSTYSLSASMPSLLSPEYSKSFSLADADLAAQTSDLDCLTSCSPVVTEAIADDSGGLTVGLNNNNSSIDKWPPTFLPNVSWDV